MAIYLVSGKLGSGKTLASVGQIRDKLLTGCKVATNLDLKLENLLPSRYGKPGGKLPVSCVRIPDKPAIDDLIALGSGNDSMDENKNGIIVLDELASWLNSRTFNDKTRIPVIDWLLHSRKHGWDVFFVCQHLEQIDKQVRTALVEYLVTCRRLDRLKIPFIGKFIQSFTAGYIKGNLPKIHIATVRYGCEKDAIVADRWVYQARDLYNAYNTRQVFTDSYSDGVYSYLTPWHLKGWNQKPLIERLRNLFLENLRKHVPAPAKLQITPKPKLPLVAMLAKLPPDQAIRHYQRLQARGVL